MDGITDLKDMSLSKLWELVMDREVLGSSPSGSRVIRRVDGVGKEIYLIRNIRLD